MPVELRHTLSWQQTTDLEGCGKASVVGMGGEIGHAQALTHTLHFGNKFREAVNTGNYLAFSNIRGAANCAIAIPLMDKNDGGRRSHYQTIQTASRMRQRKTRSSWHSALLSAGIRTTGLATAIRTCARWVAILTTRRGLE